MQHSGNAINGYDVSVASDWLSAVERLRGITSSQQIVSVAAHYLSLIEQLFAWGVSRYDLHQSEPDLVKTGRQPSTTSAQRRAHGTRLCAPVVAQSANSVGPRGQPMKLLTEQHILQDYACLCATSV